MARRMHSLDFEARPGKPAAVLQGDIVIHRNDEIVPVRTLRIGAGLPCLARHAANEGAGPLPERLDGAAVVGMGMREENMRYALALQRLPSAHRADRLPLALDRRQQPRLRPIT